MATPAAAAEAAESWHSEKSLGRCCLDWTDPCVICRLSGSWCERL